MEYASLVSLVGGIDSSALVFEIALVRTFFNQIMTFVFYVMGKQWIWYFCDLILCFFIILVLIRLFVHMVDIPKSKKQTYKYKNNAQIKIHR